MQNSNKITCAVLFSDISGSSQLYSQLGNEAAKTLVNAILDKLAEVIRSYHGKIIKTIGDEVMASFENCDRAVKAALELQLACWEQTGNSDIKLRTGIDYGEVLQDQADLFGETVNNAAYLTSIANRGKILLTEAVLQKITSKARDNCYEYDKVVLKGHIEKSSIYRLFWENLPSEGGDGVTRHVGKFEFTRESSFHTLELNYDNKTYHIDAAATPFLIGRNDKVSSLIIHSEFASRDHCQIIYRHGRFILSDHSTNGTYITQNFQPEIYLRREELPLLDNGSISIGQSKNEKGAHIIHFRTL